MSGIYECVLVGYDGSPEGEDALALAQTLAAPGARVVAACQYWYEPVGARVGKGGPGPAAMAADAEAALAALRDRLPAVETRAVPGGSPPRALHDLAESESADLIVVGSSRRGALARAAAGSTAERLLNGAPCPVAVAPRGFGRQPASPPAHIAVGFSPDPDAEPALRAARALADAAGADLRVVAVLDTLAEVAERPGDAEYPRALHEAQHRLERAVSSAVEALGGDVAAAVIPDDFPAGVLANAAADLDLLVLGSRGYGPVRRVLLGSVSHRLLSDGAPCAVLVVPRSAQAAAGTGASTRSASSTSRLA